MPTRSDGHEGRLIFATPATGPRSQSGALAPQIGRLVTAQPTPRPYSLSAKTTCPWRVRIEVDQKVVGHARRGRETKFRIDASERIVMRPDPIRQLGATAYCKRRWAPSPLVARQSRGGWHR